MTDPAAAPLAQRLLDAQVAHRLDRLRGEALTASVTDVVDTLYAAAGDHQLADLVDRAAVEDAVTRALTVVPSSAAVSGFVELALEVVRAGPVEPYPLADVVDRDQVERLVDEALALTPLLERALERLTASPLVGATVTRFMGRIVGEAIAANQAVADRIPGFGSLLAFGTRAAAGVVGAADKQLDGLLADTAGKGGTLAVRRMNRIVIETLRDPTTRDAVLQVWDLVAAAPVQGLEGRVSTDDVEGVVDAAHDLVVTTLAHPHTVAVGHAVVAGFFERFGGYTPAELLDELDLPRAEVTAWLVRLGVTGVTTLMETGAIEPIVRAELASFWESDAALALLSEAAEPGS